MDIVFERINLRMCEHVGCIHFIYCDKPEIHRVTVVWGVHWSLTHVHDVVPTQLYLLPPHCQCLGCLITIS